MANQPPNRPWFRLPNLSRQPQPPPPPAPEVVAPPPPQQPRIPVIRPAFRPAFTQSQPPPPPPPQPPQSTPSPPPSQPPLSISSPSPSPSPRLSRIATPSLISPSPSPPPPPPQQPRIPVIRPSFRPAFTQPQPPPPPPPQSQPQLQISSPSPSPSPRFSRIATPSPPPRPMIAQLPTPTPSPKPPTKTTLSPPPITLPPPQTTSSKADLNPKTMPEAEQEKVLLQDTFNKKVVFPASSHDQGSSIKSFLHKASNHSNKHHKKPSSSPSSDSEESKNVRIITMTGDNKGALMELGLASRRNEGKTQIGNFPGNGHVLGNGLKETEDLNGDNADKSKMKDDKGKKPMSGYVNSNVQDINNSILYNCSFTHHDPGVHFSVSRKKPINGGKDLTNGKKL